MLFEFAFGYPGPSGASSWQIRPATRQEAHHHLLVTGTGHVN